MDFLKFTNPIKESKLEFFLFYIDSKNIQNFTMIGKNFNFGKISLIQCKEQTSTFNCFNTAN